MSLTRLTVDDIYGRKTENAVHLDFARGESAWMFGIEGIPRLTVYDHRGRDGRRRTWSIDGRGVRDLNAALAVLNGDMTLEQAMMPPELKADQPKPAKKKYSLQTQISEVIRELKERARVYPGIQRSRPSDAAKLDMQEQIMQSVQGTLEWLQGEEDFIRWAIANKDAIRQRMEG